MTRSKLIILLLTVTLVQVLTDRQPHAAVIHVPAEAPTIQVGINWATEGDTVLVAPGTYKGPGNRDLEFQGIDLVLLGRDGPEFTVIEGDELASHGIQFDSWETAASVLDGFTITGFEGDSNGGAILCEFSSPTLRNLIVRDNGNYEPPDDYSRGVGLHCGFFASPSVSDCLFENNQSFRGGAVYLYDYLCSPTFTNIVFRGNSALKGGAVMCMGMGAEFHNCQFTSNIAFSDWTDEDEHEQGQGGAVYVCDNDAVFINCLFKGNLAESDPPLPPADPVANPGQGGAVYVFRQGSLYRSCTFYGNRAESYNDRQGGGTFFCVGYCPGPRIEQCIIAASLDGGGIFCGYEGCAPVLSCCDVFGNAYGNYLGALGDQTGENGNISVNPLFCDAPGGEFTLHELSPCLPDNNDCGLLMGVYGAGCADEYNVISGIVRDTYGRVVGGVAVTGGPEMAATDAEGFYSLAVPAGWSGTLEPMAFSQDFDPRQRHYTDIQSDFIDQDYLSNRSRILRVPENFATIQDALNFGIDGDSILVAPGEYNGPGFWRIDPRGMTVSIIGEGGSELTRIDGYGAGPLPVFFVHRGENPETLIQGFTLWSGWNNDYAGGGVSVHGASPTLRDLVVSSCHAYHDGGGIGLVEASGTVLEDLVVKDCYSESGGGIHIAHSTDVIARRILVASNQAQDGAGIACINSSVTFENLTLVNNECTRFGSGMFASFGTVTMMRTLTAFNSGHSEGLYADNEGTTFVITCNNVFANEAGNYGGALDDQTGVDGNISLDPFFCDMSGGDYSVDATSPCLPENNSCATLIGVYGQGCDDPNPRIYGTINNEEGLPIAGAEIIGGSQSVFTNAGGSYVLSVSAGWSGTLSPRAPHYDFTPPDRSYTDIQVDHMDQDYLGVFRPVIYVPGDVSGIQIAIDAALTGDTIKVAPGTYSGDYNKNLEFRGRDIVVRGEGCSGVTIIDCEGEGRGFWIHEGETAAAVIQGFSVINGHTNTPGYSGGGAIRVNLASPTLRDLVLQDSLSRTWGGGLFVYGAVNISIRNVTARNCHADDYGGGIALWQSEAIMDSILIEDNISMEMGGGLHVDDSPSVQISNLVVRGNRALGPGAGISCQESALAVDTALLHDNDADDEGGGILCVSGVIELARVSIVDNEAEVGGGICVSGGELLFSDGIVAMNRCTSSGEPGAVHLSTSFAQLAIVCSDVHGNSGGNYGGEIGDQTGVNGNISADPLFCDPDIGDFTLAQSSPCLPENNDCGVLMGAMGEGCTLTAIEEEDVPATYTLADCFPNPFNPATAIRFGLPRTSQVSLSIYDASGRRTATLLNGSELEAGWHELTWNGMDDRGRSLSSGVYFCRLEAGEFRDTMKMLLLK